LNNVAIAAKAKDTERLLIDSDGKMGMGMQMNFALIQNPSIAQICSETNLYHLREVAINVFIA
jgi:hypothetical protein